MGRLGCEIKTIEQSDLFDRLAMVLRNDGITNWFRRTSALAGRTLARTKHKVGVRNEPQHGDRKHWFVRVYVGGNKVRPNLLPGLRFQSRSHGEFCHATGGTTAADCRKAIADYKPAMGDLSY
uniref:Uncharacterized protein n=1 Tax=Candidatus Kentrum sp. UNK TaxID=2126344 RepID=A0A451AJM1_9GAMM|nr:MAG: hypothetical protein BECKUNK1418G_GA0071005_108312 [Candidatus Kentron sp. UNK]VFK71826.1 MAG: hypothetical protein BECKUNK1418H_GA0071006_108312 [Candidatus Kentron sp. UNK]